MVAKKTASKRKTLRHKYKVIKKVAEHKRKLKKLARKNPNLLKKKKADPGIPNHWPFKAELLEQIEKEREDQEAEKQRQRDAAKERKKLAAKGLTSSKSAKNDKQTEAESLIPTAPSEFSRYCFRTIHTAVDESDLILEVLDARDPLGSRWPELEMKLMDSSRSAKPKQLIFLLNKVDLVPAEVVSEWLQVLNMEAPTFACYHEQRLEGEEFKGRQIKETDVCTGIQALLQLIEMYKPQSSGKENEAEKELKVAVIGYGNVGKSSLINCLLRSPVASVGANPGFTKQVQRFRLKKGIFLYDTPSVPALAAAPGPHINLPLDDALPLARSLLEAFDPQEVQRAMSVAAYSTPDDLLAHIAASNSKLGKGGRPNLVSASRILLKRWNNTEIPYFTSSPAEAEQLKGKKKGKRSELEKLVEDANVKTLKEVEKVRKWTGNVFIQLDQSLMKPVDDDEEEEEEDEDEDDMEDEEDEEDEEDDEEDMEDDEDEDEDDDEEEEEESDEEVPQLVELDKKGRPIQKPAAAAAVPVKSNGKAAPAPAAAKKSAPAPAPVAAPAPAKKSSKSSAPAPLPTHLKSTRKVSAPDDYDFDTDFQ